MKLQSARNSGAADTERATPAPDMSPPVGEGGVRDPLPALVSLLELGRGEFTLGTVQYERSGQREGIIARLQSTVPERTLVRVSLQDPALRFHDLPVAFFQTLERVARRRGQGSYDAVLLVDWEKRLDRAQPAGRQPRTSLTSFFNMGRDILAQTLSCPLIVLLPNWAMALVQQMAPDFVSWRSGVFVFPFDPETIRRDLSEAVEAARNNRGETPDLLRRRLETSLASARILENDAALHEIYPEGLAQLAELCHRFDEPAAEFVYWERLGRWAADQQAGHWLRRARRRLRKAGRQLDRERVPRSPQQWGKIFRGVSPLTSEDVLFGREEDLDRILDMVLESTFRCGSIWGETGCGKTSLTRAGLEVVLTDAGYQTIYIDRYERFADELRCAVADEVGIDPGPASLLDTLRAATAKCGDLFLLCDQFERIYSAAGSEEEIHRFLDELNRCFDDLNLPVHFIFLLRTDYLGRLLGAFERLPAMNHPLHSRNRYQLGWLRPRDAERALAALGEQVGAGWTEEFVAEVIADLAGGARKDEVKPVQIQLAAAALYSRDVRTLTDYENAGRGQGLLKDHLAPGFDDLGKPDRDERHPKFAPIAANQVDETVRHINERTLLRGIERSAFLAGMLRAARGALTRKPRVLSLAGLLALVGLQPLGQQQRRSRTSLVADEPETRYAEAAPESQPWPPSGRPPLLAVNLVLIVALLLALHLWLFRFTEAFVETVAVFTAGGLVAWITLFAKPLSENLKAWLQHRFEHLVLVSPLTTLALMLILAAGVAVALSHGTLIFHTAGEEAAGLLTIRRFDADGVPIVTPVVEEALGVDTKRRFVLTSGLGWRRSYEVRFDRLPPLTIEVRFLRRMVLMAPNSFLRPVLILRPSAQLLSVAKGRLKKGQPLSLEVRRNQELLGSIERYAGKAILIGSDQIPSAELQDLRDSWRADLDARGHGDLLETLLRYTPLAEGTVLRGGETIQVRLRTAAGNDFGKMPVEFDVNPLEFCQEKVIHAPH